VGWCGFPQLKFRSLRKRFPAQEPVTSARPINSGTYRCPSQTFAEIKGMVGFTGSNQQIAWFEYKLSANVFLNFTGSGMRKSLYTGAAHANP
jgi:hypothetical protein